MKEGSQDGAAVGHEEVDVAAPVGVDQVGALGGIDHHGLLVAPVPLLGEGVPEMSVIERGDRLGVHECRT